MPKESKTRAFRRAFQVRKDKARLAHKIAMHIPEYRELVERQQVEPDKLKRLAIDVELDEKFGMGTRSWIDHVVSLQPYSPSAFNPIRTILQYVPEKDRDKALQAFLDEIGDCTLYVDNRTYEDAERDRMVYSLSLWETPSNVLPFVKSDLDLYRTTAPVREPPRDYPKRDRTTYREATIEDALEVYETYLELKGEKGREPTGDEISLRMCPPATNVSKVQISRFGNSRKCKKLLGIARKLVEEREYLNLLR